MSTEPRERDKIHESYDETMIEVRRLLATLHYNARDQAQDEPAHDRDHSRENIDSSACELGVQLNLLEDIFREMAQHPGERAVVAQTSGRRSQLRAVREQEQS